MTNKINVNGISMEYNNGRLVIEGLEKPARKSVDIDKSGNIKGDVTGDVRIVGDNVTLIVEGDITGNIIGNGEVEVHGDVTGNIVGRTIKN